MAEIATDVTIRPATLDDLPRMMEIYNHYVINTPTTFDMEPKDLAERREWFSHYAETGRHRLLVAVRDGDVAGYTSSSSFHPRAAYDTTVETTILCAPEHVGYGIGQRLYEALFDALARRGHPLRRRPHHPPQPRLDGAARAPGLPARRRHRGSRPQVRQVLGRRLVSEDAVAATAR